MSIEATLDLSRFIGPEENAPELYGAALPILGVDYSCVWSPGLIGSLKNGSYRFAGRYIGTPGRGKSLRLEEVAALRAADIKIFSFFEDTEGGALLGAARGKRDADAAFADMSRLGEDSAPCYFACDTNTTGPAVAAYYDAIRNERGERTGAYGGGPRVIRWLFDHGLISFGCQTRAWSTENGVVVWDPRAQLRQFPLKSPFYVGACDLEWAMTPNYGQWGAAPQGDDDMTDPQAAELDKIAEGTAKQSYTTPISNALAVHNYAEAKRLNDAFYARWPYPTNTTGLPVGWTP